MNKKEPQAENVLYPVSARGSYRSTFSKRMLLILLPSYQQQQSSPYSYKPYSDRQPPLQ